MVSKKRSEAIPMPTDATGWLHEIATAYLDAGDSIVVGPVIGIDVKPDDLFHLGPAVCVKFRGAKGKRKLKQAMDAAFTSYVAMTNQEPEALAKPHMAFAFSYLAAHYGLDLLSEEQVYALMDFIEEREEQLASMVAVDGVQ